MALLNILIFSLAQWAFNIFDKSKLQIEITIKDLTAHLGMVFLKESEMP